MLTKKQIVAYFLEKEIPFLGISESSPTDTGVYGPIKLKEGCPHSQFVAVVNHATLTYIFIWKKLEDDTIHLDYGSAQIFDYANLAIMDNKLVFKLF